MPVIKVICKNCGRFLGRYSQPQFGIGDMDTQTQYDPDCEQCNPFYHMLCEKCGTNNINSEGICNFCKSKHVIIKGEK